MTAFTKYFRTLLCAAALTPVWAGARVASLPPPEIAARNYMLVDVTANQVLASKDVDAQIEPASLTKLMTGYLVFDALRTQKTHPGAAPACQ